jgi:predicted TIM-barrel fold metal-dependent hydrolase
MTDQFSRRGFLSGGSTGLFAASLPVGGAAQEQQGRKPLDISDYEPRSMLHVKETRVERSRYPVIDVHAHLSFSTKSEKGVPLAAERMYPMPAADVLRIMDRKNIRTMINLTGGFGKGLEDAIARYDKAYPGRFYTFTEPCYGRFDEPDYPKVQAELIESAHRSGARGLKVVKTIGLYLREHVTSGQLVKVDDRRFDPMWEACGELKMPVAIHVSDPLAFFTPTDRFNERFEELNNHPDWSFHGGDFPSNAEILEARNRVIERHPKTQFIVLHVGNFAEDLASVSRDMDRFRNMSVEIGARIGELGRQPRTARRFIEKFQDRVLFGTDAVPNGDDTPQQVFGDKLYETYYRFLETEDEYFDYSPARVPPQGRWRIYGIALPDNVLEKVYQGNAARILGI